MACDNDLLLCASDLRYADLKNIRLQGHDGNWELPESCVPPKDTDSYLLNTPRGNPDLATDAELWGWDLDEDILNKVQFPVRK